MTWLDIVILLPLLIGIVMGLIRGVVTELFTILSVIGGFFGAKLWAAGFSNWLHAQVNWSTQICDVLAYALLFLAVATVLAIIGKLVSKLLVAIKLGIVNRLLGSVFGAAKWLLIVLIIVFCVDKIDSQFGILKQDLKHNSPVYTTAVQYSHKALSAVQVQVQNSL